MLIERRLMAMTAMTKFQSRYVLAEGYPWVTGLGNAESPYTDVRMWEEPKASRHIEINWPDELWSNDVPKYRLVLERVE